MQYLGAHMSIAGGLHKAVERIAGLAGTALQLFTRNQRQWQAPELTREEVRAFAQARQAWGDFPVAAHDSYLVNLATPDPEHWARSIQAFSRELERAARLSIPWLVTHPGSHLGQGVEQGLKRYVQGLDQALDRYEEGRGDLAGPEVTVLLETTAGQGTNLGGCFEELAGIMERSRFGHRLGICFDTCHAFAAGYDLRDRKACEKTFDSFQKVIGLEKIALFHLNDSKTGLGEHKDRHEHIGQGRIGLEGFRYILNHPRLKALPMVLETPKGKDLKEDAMNLKTLRSLVKEKSGE